MDVMVTQALSAWKNWQQAQKNLEVAQKAHEQARSFLNSDQIAEYMVAVEEDAQRQRDAEARQREVGQRLVSEARADQALARWTREYPAALLPTGQRMNPAHPEDATYFDLGQVAYVMENIHTGALRVFTSFGNLGPDWAVGTQHDVKHDQTSRFLGVFKVTGIRSYSTGTTWGEVPDKKLAHWVFK